MMLRDIGTVGQSTMLHISQWRKRGDPLVNSPTLNLIFPLENLRHVRLRRIDNLGCLGASVTQNGLYLVDRRPQVDEPLSVPVAEGVGGDELVFVRIIAGLLGQHYSNLPH